MKTNLEHKQFQNIATIPIIALILISFPLAVDSAEMIGMIVGEEFNKLIYSFEHFHDSPIY